MRERGRKNVSGVHPLPRPSLSTVSATLLEIRKSQDLAKDLGGTASKAEKKSCQSKIVSYIQKHNKTVVPKMKTT